MQISIEPSVSEQLEWLGRSIQSGLITQYSVHLATGVHQSQISRILSGRLKRASKNVLKICKYAEEMHNIEVTRLPLDPRLIKAINQVWDGSHEHAEAIAKVILSLKGMTAKQEAN
jgi:hypothetical protein